jgi:carboxypeptidase family protein
MAQKENEQIPVEPKKIVESAPELPHEVAKQYGLHHEDDTKTITESPVAAIGAATLDKVIEDPKTDAAVDDILTKEGDDLLAVQDAQTAPQPSKRGFWKKTGHFFAAWWRNKWARWATIVLLLAAIGTTAAIPKARYAVLNTVGVRSSASVTVLDNTTQLPLKNVAVELDGHKVRTDVKGVATFKDLKLGTYDLVIRRIAFAPQERAVTIGWGSNPLGTFKLRATGIQYTLAVTDYLSGRPISGAEVVSEESNALSDNKGKVILTVEDTEDTTLSVEVSAPGYRKQLLKLDATASTTANVKLVPAQKAVYVSKQSGKYDVYSSDLDGKNKKLLLAGTGNENSNLSLVTSPNNQRAALVSTRDNLRDDDGFLLFALTIIDIRTGSAVTVDHAQQIQLIDWVGDRLVYRMTLAGASAADPQRSRIISFNYDSNARIQLATANQFNMALGVKGHVYYAPSGSDPQAALGLYKVKTDGSGRKRLAENEVWTGLRSTYNTLSLQTPDGWYAYTLNTEKISKTGAPPMATSYLFVDDSKAKRSAWTDIRDGKGVLLMYDVDKDTNTTLVTQDGLTAPISWVGDKAIVYRIVTGSESADYVISPAGGQPHKLADVTAARGFGY